ncbi:MAG: helix-turn-helix domain-containing protein [Bacteroidota bacterium]
MPGEQRNYYWNRFLGLILLAMLWWLMEFLSVRNVYEIPLNVFYGTRYGSWLILGPLTYFYFKAITQQEWRWLIKDSIHFIPFLVFVVIVPLLSKESLSQRQIHYGMLAVFDYRPKTVTLFEYCYSTIFYLQFLHLGIYLFINAQLIERYGKALKQSSANLNELSWLRIFNSLLLITLFASGGFLYLLFKSDIYRRALDYLYVFPLGLFVYAASYKLAGIRWTQVEMSPAKYQTSSLKNEDKDAYLKHLKDLMTKDKPYLNPELRLKGLAVQLEIPPHHLSQIINENYERSFFDFINSFRVEEAKHLIKARPNHTLLQIAFAAGFNNKTSFVNAFKKFAGTTPSNFRTKAKVNS